MASRNEIRSEKILLKDVFEMWFRIPEYQRPYVWTYEQIHDLLDDLTFASLSKPDTEYFLGSFVFQYKPANSAIGRMFDEHDLLDGQQRLTTLMLLLAVIRDITQNEDIKSTCQTCIFQKADIFRHIPERVRLVFDIRDSVKDFIEKFIKNDNGTNDKPGITAFVNTANDLSVRNMSKAIDVIRTFLNNDEVSKSLEQFFDFILNKVLMIYVATEDLEDAFRLFTILNDRGIPLRNSDILKSINLGALTIDSDKMKYAKMWEEAEGELGDDFDRFLNHLRTILVKEKARLSLLKEFEDRIYNPQEKDKSTGKVKPILLEKGKPTFVIIEKYLGHYKQLLGGSNHDVCNSFKFDNLIKVMQAGLPATDWIPPLLHYYDRFGKTRLLDFLQAVNRKFAGDWISQKTPTDRIEAMNAVTKILEQCKNADDVLSANVFSFDKDNYRRAIEGNIYGRRFTLYILLMLDYLYQNHDQKMHFEMLSVEHILPQNPLENSQWSKDFTQGQQDEWTDRLGNLVLITRRKNASQGRLDYSDKKKKYFDKNIDTCPNSLRLLNKYSNWTLNELEENHNIVLCELAKIFNI